MILKRTITVAAVVTMCATAGAYAATEKNIGQYISADENGMSLEKRRDNRGAESKGRENKKERRAKDNDCESFFCEDGNGKKGKKKNDKKHLSEVPLPASGMLALMGVGALAMVRRRRKSS